MLYIDENKMEELKEYVSKRAVDVFLSTCKYMKESIENLKTKKFHMGDYVVFIKHDMFLNDFYDIETNSIGKISGYYSYINKYVVYFNDDKALFTPMNEDDLRLYNEETDGEIPDDVKEYNPFSIKSMTINL